MDWVLYDNSLRHERVNGYSSPSEMFAGDLNKSKQEQIQLSQILNIDNLFKLLNQG